MPPACNTAIPSDKPLRPRQHSVIYWWLRLVESRPNNVAIMSLDFPAPWKLFMSFQPYFLRYLIVANMYNIFVHLRIILEVMKRAGTYARVDNEITMVYDCIRFRDNPKIQQGTKQHIITQPCVKTIKYELKLSLRYVCDSED